MTQAKKRNGTQPRRLLTPHAIKVQADALIATTARLWGVADLGDFIAWAQANEPRRFANMASAMRGRVRAQPMLVELIERYSSSGL